MAWVTEYDLTWTSGNAYGGIYLQRDEGSYQFPLKLQKESLELPASLDNWESHIVKRNCSFTIINDRDDFYDLMPLMTISTGQIRCIVTFQDSAEINLFVGYLNCEAVQQNMYKNAPLRLTASGLLNKLQYDHPTTIDTLKNLSMIDAIDACLTMTGFEYDIRVNCSLYELNDALASGETLFNKTGVFTEVFWKNNVDRISALDILETILNSFQCYLYWFDDCWYIEHYQDMGTTPSKTYVEYTTGVSYEDGDAGSNQVITIGTPPDIHAPVTHPQKWPSQIIGSTPGMKLVEVRLNQKQFFNLINGDLSDIVYSSSTVPLPSRRTWEGYEDANMDWVGAGSAFQDISNNVFRRGYSALGNGDANGLVTSFKITRQSDTTMTLKWKLGIHTIGDVPGSSPLEDYTVTFRYWVQAIAPVGEWPSAYFLTYGESSQQWGYTIATIPAGLINLEVSGADFDSTLLTVEASVVIPIGEIFDDSATDGVDDITILFGVGTEEFDDDIITPAPLPYAHYGDFHASISEEPDNNLITGTLNTDFLDKKTIKMDLFDSGWSYRNQLLRGSTFQYKASDWGYDSASDSLSRWMLANKFRLYNVARQDITVDYILAERLRPLQLWYDNKQSDKEFILTKDNYKPETDTHSVTLREFDDSTEINLV